ncbi:MAG TPA: hypothetical protein VKS20_06130 [Candidatus Acidoferrales bacterium]|nr:hypothetical protein [Candidatus Acidoferrales bacterium]
MKSLLVMISLFAFWPFGGGKNFRMTPSPEVPGAHGTVNVKRDKTNGNTQLDIKVKNLASPATLTPPENVYIVWVEPRTGDAEKEGVIRVGGNEQGELSATTTARQFKVSITAEKSESVNTPSGMQVLYAQVNP